MIKVGILYTVLRKKKQGSGETTLFSASCLFLFTLAAFLL